MIMIMVIIPLFHSDAASSSPYIMQQAVPAFNKSAENLCALLMGETWA
jgi:hypothetical protein